MPEIIKSDVNGYVVPKRDHEALAEKVIKLLSDDKLRAKLGKTGRQQVESMYTKRIYAENVVKVYEKAIEKYPCNKKVNVKQDPENLQEEEIELRV